MLRYTFLAVHVAELLLYTWLVHDPRYEGAIDWFIDVLGLALLVRLILVALTFLIARTPLKPVALAVSALAAEFYATVYVFSYAAIRSMPKHIEPSFSDRKHLPVLFIHGFTCNAGFWRRFIAQFAPRWGAHIATIDLEPVNGHIEQYADPIERRLDELLSNTDANQCLIVAHSMGGLATRHFLRSQAARDKVAGVVTLGTPHSGTRMANFSFAPNAVEMRRQSEWIENLVKDEEHYALPAIEALVGTHDNIVSPQDSADLSSATNTYMSGISHLAMALNENVIEWTYERCTRLSAQARQNETPEQAD